MRPQAMVIVDHFTIVKDLEPLQQDHRFSHTFAQRKQHLEPVSLQNDLRCCQGASYQNAIKPAAIV